MKTKYNLPNLENQEIVSKCSYKNNPEWSWYCNFYCKPNEFCEYCNKKEKGQAK